MSSLNALQPTKRIIRAIFMHTPKEHNMPFRPLEAKFDDNVASQLIDDTAGFTNITSASLSNVAGKIVAPASEAKGVVLIENTWEESRFAFIIEVEINRGGKRVIEVHQGYTDHLGAVQRGAEALVSPEMKLVFNTRSVLRVSSIADVGGARSVFTAGKRTNQICESVIANGTDIDTVTDTMRPADILAAASTERDLTIGIAGNNIADTRTIVSSSGTPIDTKYNNASNYLADTFSAFKRASDTADDMGEERYVYGEARNYVETETNASNEFLYSLINRYNTSSSATQSSEFTWSQMITAYPELDTKAEFVFPKGGIIEDARVDTQSLGGSNKHALIAYTLGHIIPTVMFSNKCGSFAGEISNMGIGGRPACALEFFKPIYVSEADASPFINNIVHSFENEIIRMVVDTEITDFRITFKSTIGMSSKIAIDLFDGTGPVPMRVPNYAAAKDLLLASTDGGNQLAHVTAGLKGAFESIASRSVGSGHQQPSSVFSSF